MYNDPTQAKINNRMSELTQFQGRYVREDAGPNPYPSSQNAAVNNPHPQNTGGHGLKSHGQGSAVSLNGSRVDERQRNYQLAMQQHQPQQHPATYDDNVDPRQDMNSRLDRFRFETVNPTGSLVPVNMDHIYSGNLFAEGLPVPSDLRNQFTLANPNVQHQYQQGASRILHQEKSKTGYRNDVNDRLSKLSPIGRALYYPVTGNGQSSQQPQTPNQQPQQQPQNWGAGMAQSAGQYVPMQFQQQQAQMTSRRGALTDDINSRMSNHPALGTPMPLDENMVNFSRNTLYPSMQQQQGANPNMTPNLDPNKQVKKVVYQDMYPVMSNY